MSPQIKYCPPCNEDLSWFDEAVKCQAVSIRFKDDGKVRVEKIGWVCRSCGTLYLDKDGPVTSVKFVEDAAGHDVKVLGDGLHHPEHESVQYDDGGEVLQEGDDDEVLQEGDGDDVLQEGDEKDTECPTCGPLLQTVQEDEDEEVILEVSVSDAGDDEVLVEVSENNPVPAGPVANQDPDDEEDLYNFVDEDLLVSLVGGADAHLDDIEVRLNQDQLKALSKNSAVQAVSNAYHAPPKVRPVEIPGCEGKWMIHGSCSKLHAYYYIHANQLVPRDEWDRPVLDEWTGGLHYLFRIAQERHGMAHPGLLVTYRKKEYVCTGQRLVALPIADPDDEDIEDEQPSAEDPAGVVNNSPSTADEQPSADGEQLSLSSETPEPMTYTGDPVEIPVTKLTKGHIIVGIYKVRDQLRERTTWVISDYDVVLDDGGWEYRNSYHPDTCKSLFPHDERSEAILEAIYFIEQEINRTILSKQRNAPASTKLAARSALMAIDRLRKQLGNEYPAGDGDLQEGANDDEASVEVLSGEQPSAEDPAGVVNISPSSVGEQPGPSCTGEQPGSSCTGEQPGPSWRSTDGHTTDPAQARVRELPGVGHHTEKKLSGIAVLTVGDLAKADNVTVLHAGVSPMMVGRARQWIEDQGGVVCG